MKTLVLAMMTLASMTAHAATLMNCTTPGDALSSVEVIENSNGLSTLAITLMDGSVKRLKMISNTSRLKAGSSTTLIAARNPDSAMGGEILNAAMLQILPGQKKANLAYRGSVFVLSCTK
jgi:hypothetical protein